MEILSIVGSIASILSLCLSVFVAYKVVRIGNTIDVKGSKNITVGGNASIRGK